MDLVLLLCVLGLLVGVIVLIRTEDFREAKGTMDPPKARVPKSHADQVYHRCFTSTSTPRLAVRSGLELFASPQLVLRPEVPTVNRPQAVLQEVPYEVPSVEDYTPCLSHRTKKVVH